MQTKPKSMIAYQAESKVLVGTQDGTPMTGFDPPDWGCEGRRKHTVLLSGKPHLVCAMCRLHLIPPLGTTGILFTLCMEGHLTF